MEFSLREEQRKQNNKSLASEGRKCGSSIVCTASVPEKIKQ